MRAAIRKGIDSYFQEFDADIIMLQETRMLEEQKPKGWDWPSGYFVELHCAEKKGYSGVATLAKGDVEIISHGMPSKLDPEDKEGRIITSKHGNLTCINTYLPSGSNKDERQLYKEEWMLEWQSYLQQFVASDEPVIVCGDLNIAHREDDIWNPTGNKKSSGFLPQERDWFTDLLDDGWQDLFREHVGDGVKLYSWWSNRGQARVKDRGWRIDYFLGNVAAAKLVKDVRIERRGGLEISDHAPVILDLEL